MLEKIITNLIEIIKGSDISEVYSVYDAFPLEKKGRDIVTFVGINSLTARKPVYSLTSVYCPFTAQAEVTVSAPLECSAGRLYAFFDEIVYPRVISSANFYSGIKSVSVKTDSNMNRLVLDAVFEVTGVVASERTV